MSLGSRIHGGQFDALSECQRPVALKSICSLGDEENPEHAARVDGEDSIVGKG